MEFAWPDAGTVLQFYRLTLSLLIWVMTGLASLASIVCLLCLLQGILSTRRYSASPTGASTGGCSSRRRPS